MMVDILHKLFIVSNVLSVISLKENTNRDVLVYVQLPTGQTSSLSVIYQYILYIYLFIYLLSFI